MLLDDTCDLRAAPPLLMPLAAMEDGASAGTVAVAI